MSTYKNLSGTIESKMFNSWWLYRQKYYDLQTEEEFEEAILSGDHLCQEYAATESGEIICEMVTMHLEDCAKRLRKKEENKKKEEGV